ncbi:MAG: alpha/beta fold hydrolase [Chloroflexi bacterium]|nr:alpha/beta fold hydrolase [Anaerolineaceae bacterium]NMB89940.1 alpha/beta fold hydrolase [Chloroflexota bacterium]
MPTTLGLYYTIQRGGAKDDPVVVLLHGAGSSHLCWPPEIRRLRGTTVLTLDLPGHGRSGGVARHSVEAYARCITDFLAELGLYRVILVGHSLGGAIALCTYLQQPYRIAALGLVSSGACLPIDPALADLFTRPAGQNDGIQALMSRLFDPAASPALVERTRETLATGRPGVLQADWLASQRVDLRNEIFKIVVPALVVTGESDALIPPVQSRFLAARIPHARLVVVPRAGHMVMLEQAELVAGELQQLVQRTQTAWNSKTALSTLGGFQAP